MSEGLITFFEYDELGFFRYGQDYCEPLEMQEMLKDLADWHETRVSLADTLPWDSKTAGYENRKKVYLKSIVKDKFTGDYLIVLWRTIGNGDGVYGIPSNSSLDDNQLYEAGSDTNGKEIIWGEAAYYWFTPDLQLFASIKFPNSVADTALMNKYLKDFVNLQSSVKAKKREDVEGKQGTYTKVTFEARDGKSNLWLRISSKQCIKITDQADLASIASQITHFVKREVISAESIQQTGWKAFFSGLPYISNEINRDTRKIEFQIDASPTTDELMGMFETYNTDYSGTLDGWSNLGFRKKDGNGGICWLNKFVLRSSLSIENYDETDSSGYYTAENLLSAIRIKRTPLLSPFANTTPEPERLVSGVIL
jgi:hypothetical protein